MADLVIDNLKNRKISFDNEIRNLAYERIKLMRRVDEIDNTLNQLEGAQIANDLIQKDIELQETIDRAKASETK
jgi:hypothetical protein